MVTRVVASNEDLGRPLAKRAFTALMRVQRALVYAHALTPELETDCSLLAAICGAYEGVYDAMKWQDNPIQRSLDKAADQAGI